MSNKIENLKQAIIDGDQDSARLISEELLGEGLDPLMTIEECVYPAVSVVGERFEKGEYFLTELILSAEAMKSAVAVLMNKIDGGNTGQGLGKKGTILLGTVKGDVHEIGKNLVATMLRVNGFDVHDIGKDVPNTEFFEQAKAVKADIIGLSALMTNTMQNQREVINYFKEKKIKSFRIVVGGAPTSQDWANEIGADGWAPDAPSSVALAERVLKKD
jgi:corrinoid protein of di/trimethylamine methyltransferase